MIAEKKISRATLNPKLQTLFQESRSPASDDVAQVLRLDMMDRKVAGMALWPYDIGILGRLSVIAASVTAILISRIIALVFHILARHRAPARGSTFPSVRILSVVRQP